MKELKVLSLFSGIGAFESALTNLNIKHEVVNYCEIDKYASCAYSAIHTINEDVNLGDITKVNFNEIKDFNLLVGGSPCQDFSVAGKGTGAMWECEKCGHKYNPLEAHYTKRNNCPNCQSIHIKKTRSSLIVYFLKALEIKRPKHFIYENVKGLLNINHKETFELFIEELKEYGYKVKYKILNSKDFGVPQNRERLFCVGTLDNNIDFEFPIGFDNHIRLKDILEKNIPTKYYLSDEKASKLIFDNKKVLGNVNPSGKGQGGNVYNINHLAPTLTVNHGEGNKIGIPVINGTKKGYIIANDGDGINISFPNSKSRRGRVLKGISPTLDTGSNQCIIRVGKLDIKELDQNKRVFSIKGISPTITTTNPCKIFRLKNKEDIKKLKSNNIKYRIRKLMPLEAWRLQGFSDEDYWKARKSLECTFYKGKDKSNSQMYKMSGNSITVNVLEAIFKSLFIE